MSTPFIYLLSSFLCPKLEWTLPGSTNEAVNPIPYGEYIPVLLEQLAYPQMTNWKIPLHKQHSPIGKNSHFL